MRPRVLSSLLLSGTLCAASLFGVALMGVLLVSGPSALAGDDAAPGEESALSQLEPKELAYLREKFPEWDKVDGRRKEHIARNVLRLREMTPEERATLKRRMARLHKRRKGHHGGGRRGPSLFRMADAIGARILEQLPPAVRVELAKLDVRPSLVKMTLFKLAKSKAAAGMSLSLPTEELAALPDAARKKVERLLASLEAAEPGKQKSALESRLRQMHLHLRMEGLLRRLQAAAPKGRVDPTQLTQAMLTEWADVVDGLVAGFSEDPQKITQAVQRMERGRMSHTDFVRTIWALERLATGKWKDDSEAQAAVQQVVQRLLVDELGADRERASALPGYDAGAERRRALGKLIGTGTARGGSHRGGAHRGRPHRGGAGESRRGRGDRRDGRRRGGPGGPRRSKRDAAPDKSPPEEDAEK